LIRKRLLAGLFSILPLGVTVWFLKIVFQVLIGIFDKPLFWGANLLEIHEPSYWQQAVFSILAMGCLLFAIGTLIQNFFGRRLLGWMDMAMMQIPGIKGIYGATKQVMTAIQQGKGGTFKEVVLVPWPNSDSKTIAFIANRECGWAFGNGEKRVAVYVPSAPNPTTGYVIMLDESVIQPLNITPEQALTWVVSGGAAMPVEAANKNN
jgi:uncharacterized membrane protein